MKVIHAIAVVSLMATATYAKNERSHFLSRGPGVAAYAQGEAFVSRAEDASSIYYNPAGLAKQKGEIHAQYLPLTGGARYNFLGFTLPAGKLGTFGLGVIQLHRGGIEKRLNLGDEPTETGATQTAFFLPYARDFRVIQLGLALKYLRYGLDGISGSGFGADLGAQKHLPLKKLAFFHNPQLSFGASIKNLIKPSFKLIGETKESLPTDLTAGLSLSGYLFGGFSEAAKAVIRDKLTLSADVFYTPGANMRFGAGIEYAIRQFVSLRAGHARGQIATGVGFFIGESFGLDYAFSLAGLANQHRFSVSYKFGKDKRYMTEAPKEVRLYSTIKEARDLKDRHMRLARAALREKKYPEARTNYDKAFILDPADKSAERSLRQVEEAIVKQTVAALLADIQTAKESKDNPAVLRALIALAEADPKYPNLKKELSAVEAVGDEPRLRRVGSPISSAVNLSVSQIYEQAVQRLSVKARANIQAEDFEEAEKNIASLRVITPEAPAIWKLSEELSLAKKASPQNTAIKPAENGNKLYLRQLYAASAISYARENYSQAEASARQLLAMDPGNKEAQVLLRHMSRNGHTKEDAKE